MDADRFDALARSLSSRTMHGSRRGLLRGLLSGMVGLIATGLDHTEGSAGNEAGNIDRRPPRRRRRRPERQPKPPRWKAPGCQKRSLQRCLKPAERRFVRRIEPCRTKCEANQTGRACKACIRPHAVDLANAAAKCTDRFCRGGTAQPAGTTSAAGRTAVGAAESGELRSAALRSCQYQQFETCESRAERDYVICLVGAGAACVGSVGIGCAVAVAACGVLLVNSSSDCNQDFGCSPGICLPSNVCCPTGFHSPCNDTCCPPEQECQNGTCQCPAGKCSRLCPCPAGQTCLSTGECCPSERVTSFGTCNPCPPAQVCGSVCCPSNQICEGGVCKCPGGVLQCGTTCCSASAVGCEGGRCALQCDLDNNCGG